MFSLIPCAIMGTLGVWAVFLQTFEGRTFMDPMYTQNNYKHEVDLKDLIFAILHQWKPILVIAIAFAVLLGGGKGFLTYRSQSDPETAAQKEEDYQKAVEQYENDVDYSEHEIQNIQAAIESQQNYLEKSILMNLSPYSIYEAQSDLFIKTDYEIMPGMIYQNIDYTNTILQAYQSVITSTAFLETIGSSNQLDPQYLQELVSVERGSISAVESGSTELTNILTIKVKHTNAEDAQKILDSILKQIDILHRQIKKDIGEHTIQAINNSCGSIVDWALADNQSMEMIRLQNLKTTLSEKEAALKELSMPSNINSSKIDALKSAVKYGVLGGGLGGFVGVLFICVWFLMSDKLYSPKELRSRFQVKVLGSLPMAGKPRQNFIDAWLNRLEGRVRQNDADSESKLIAANIKNQSGSSKTIFIAGCADPESVTQVAAYLREHLPGIQIISGGNILQNADAILKLPECDSIVLVEQCGISSYQAIELEMEKIRDLKKELLGFVVFE